MQFFWLPKEGFQGEVNADSASCHCVERLQLRNDFQVFWPSRGALDVNEFFQTQTKAVCAKNMNGFRMRPQRIIRAPSRNFSEQIEIAQRGREGYIQAGPDRYHIPRERKARWTDAGWPRAASYRYRPYTSQ